MPSRCGPWIVLLAILGCWPTRLPAEPVTLFDGKTFAGWEGDTKNWWRIEDGCLVGGTLTKKIPHNYFLATTRGFSDFKLTLQFKLLGDPKKGFVNSGVQFRSQRVPNSTEMVGYQCDLGDPTWWGSIYDESRRNKVLAQADIKAIDKVLKRGDWNEYVIQAEGRRIRTWINGVLGVDYTEPDPAIPQTGHLGLQIHSGGPAEVWFKDITIEEMQPGPKNPPAAGAPPPPPPPGPSPLSPADQLKTFSLPPGFTIELVASEPAVGKPITVAWDAAGRMWTMTALEYPVDANEDRARSEALFREGGRDRVLIFDRPFGPGLHQPRTFADQLAIPLGLLPYRDGAFVQYGSKILFLRDTTGDGVADRRDVILDGFGTEDSHLFPHQFTRGPGGWIYLAQGAFNRSTVRSKDGQKTTFNFCKMGRFTPDGQTFELVQAGLNNIWGFVITRTGEMFIQEANDLGYPVVPLALGASFPGIGMEKVKPYSPWEPALGNHIQMGGTGLSGLALAEDLDGWPEPYRGTFFIANPITSRLQMIRAVPDGVHIRLEKWPDFLLSSDLWFRPVAIHFGPDGCLYIADWYNKIISHNEVPRNHPERDKTRGRIWRIRHATQTARPVPDLTKASDTALLGHLRAANTWEARSACHEIVDRQTRSVIPDLEKLAADPGASVDARIRALWALEGLQHAGRTIELLVQEKHGSLVREAMRAAGSGELAPSAVVALAETLERHPDPKVRAEVIRTVGRLPTLGDNGLSLLLRMVRAPLSGPIVRLQQGNVEAKVGDAHDRDFERFLIRSALEKHQRELAAWLPKVMHSPAAPDEVERWRFAFLALEPRLSAEYLAHHLESQRTPPLPEEVQRLIEYGNPKVLSEQLGKMNDVRIFHAMLALADRLPRDRLVGLLAEPTNRLVRSPERERRDLGYRLARTFRLNSTADAMMQRYRRSETTPEEQLSIVQAIRAMEVDCSEFLADAAGKAPPGSILRSEALRALAASRTSQGQALFLAMCGELAARERQLGLLELASTKPGARTLAQALRHRRVGDECLDAALLEKLQLVLGSDPDLDVVMERNRQLLRSVLVLDGADDGYADHPITLKGPFTVECWIRLQPGISNNDSILGRPGVACFNFAGGHFRIWFGPVVRDVIIAKRPMVPEMWTHVAATRDTDGRCRLYLNGELDSESTRTCQDTLADLRVGWSNPPQGTRAALAEYRVWNYARAPDQIRDTFDLSLEGQTRPPGLAHYFPGGGPWGRLHGTARVARTLDAPPLLTKAESAALAEKFGRFRKLAEQAGEVARGREVFAKNCLACHAVAGQGGQIGPTLNGVGVHGTETLLRHLLTPSAAMEPGYRLFRLELRNGTLKEGFLVSQTQEHLFLRQQGKDDEVIRQSDIVQSGFTRRSVMPDGLLESMKPDEVQDLFAYLKSLK